MCGDSGETRRPGPIVFGAQVEAATLLGSYPSQLIETNDAPKTRRDDVLRFDGTVSTDFDDPWQVTVWPAFASSELVHDEVGVGAESVHIILSFENALGASKATLWVQRISQSSDVAFIFQSPGVNGAWISVRESTLTWERGDKIMLVVEPNYGPNQSKLTVNITRADGSSVSEDTIDDDAFILSDKALIRVGSETRSGNIDSTYHHFFGRIAPPKPF